ncbi:MAG: O-antigen ligase family protein [Hylemonella sp.]|nr:O-antigen ligase family protein [Hylemonella sp.]
MSEAIHETTASPPASRTSALLESLSLRPGDGVVLLLAAMMLLAPAVGVPHEYMLQDTLKSMMVAFGTLAAAWLLLWQNRQRNEPLQWHGVLWLPLLLMVYALGSMAWSHTYLAAVEAVRWFVFFVLLWVGMNSLTRERVPMLVSGIHWGAVLAALWAALQFWFDFQLFPQGASPASTFINRNFFAEFVVCTLPFSLWLLVQARNSSEIALRAFFLAFNLVAILMTGTRSALLGLLFLLLVLPPIVWMYRQQFELAHWRRHQAWLALAVLLATVAGLGSLPTGNPQIETEKLGHTALQRSFFRAASLVEKDAYTKGSASVRLIMWKSTARMIEAHPVTGVGAGAWEAVVPLYQVNDELLETDFYAHNEILQLLAEYGLAGWGFLLGLLTYLSLTAWRTWNDQSDAGQEEAPLRALALACLLALLVVSCAGFPWRMASTGALFALALAILIASDVRLGIRGSVLAHALPWSPRRARLLMIFVLACLVLAVYIALQAAASERRLVMAVKLAATVSQSGEANHPRWEPVKAQILQLTREGIAINSHYRKITPLVGDQLTVWGDWTNAIWIWESVVDSRPYVSGILANIARGYLQTGNSDKAAVYLERIRLLRPNTPMVHSLEVAILNNTGQQGQAIQLIRQYLQEGSYDFDLLNTAYLLGMQAKDWPLALQALQLRNERWPMLAWDGWLKMGDIYTLPEVADEARALQAYRAAVAAVAEAQKDAVRQKVPPAYRARL